MEYATAMYVRRSSAPRAWLLGLVLVGVFLAGCDDDARDASSLNLPSADLIEMVEVEVRDEERTVTETARTTDRVATKSLLAVLAGGQRVPPHKCVDRGRILLHASGGGVVELQMLPGHHGGRCEFRREDITFSAPRTALIDALRLAGVKHVPTESP